MGFIFSLLLFFLLIFYVLPRLITPLLSWYVRRKARTMFTGFPGGNPFDNGAGRQRSGGRTRNESQPHPAAPKKKIGKDVGEYIDFEEISVSTTQTADTTQTTVNYKREQQITDVEWEDVG